MKRCEPTNQYLHYIISCIVFLYWKNYFFKETHLTSFEAISELFLSISFIWLTGYLGFVAYKAKIAFLQNFLSLSFEFPSLCDTYCSTCYSFYCHKQFSQSHIISDCCEDTNLFYFRKTLVIKLLSTNSCYIWSMRL